MKRIILAVIVLVSVGAIALTLVNNKQDIEARTAEAMITNAFVPVGVEVVSEAPVKIRFEANGVFEPDQYLELKSEANGKVVSIHRRKGDAVSVGDLIARVDDTLLQTELRVAKANQEKTAKDLERFKNLASTDAITGRQLEDVQLGYETVSAQVTALEKRIADTRITAPISGVINNEHIEIGAFLGVGSPVVDIVKASPLKLAITVSESDVARIKRGDQITVYSSTDRGTALTGTVQFIAAKADAQLRYPVEVRLREAAGVKPGMFGYAVFESEDAVNVTTISRKAIATSLKDPQVYVVNNDRVELRTVNIRPIDADRVEVLSGVELGERVVVSGHINLRNGSAVQVAQ